MSIHTHGPSTGRTNRASRPTLLIATAILVTCHSTVFAGQTIQADNEVLLQIKAQQWKLDGPFAEQTIEVELQNPHDKALETTLRVPLPNQARLKGYSLDVNGEMRRAVPVERIKAKTAFEQTVRAKIDPALAEKGAGNEYQIRIFPVPAGGTRRVLIDIASLADRGECGWQHSMERQKIKARHAVNATIASATLPSTTNGKQELRWEKTTKGYVSSWHSEISDTLSLCIPAPKGNAHYSTTLPDGLQMDWLDVPARPLKTPTQPLPNRFEIVWDASFSQHNVSRHEELELLQRLTAGRPVEVTVTILRQDIQRRNFRISTHQDQQALLAFLLDQPADGATHIGAWRPADNTDAAFFFSDLVSTWPGDDLPISTVPVHIISATAPNPVLAHALTRNGGSTTSLNHRTVDETINQLKHPDSEQLHLGPFDKEWYSPLRQAHQRSIRACHIANSPSAIPVLPVKQLLPGGAHTVVRHKATGGPSSASANYWCALWWSEQLESDPDKHRTKLALIGEQFGITNTGTSLLVLENDHDYVRHGIMPPEADTALRQRIVKARQQAELEHSARMASHLSDIAKAWLARTEWWVKSYPKDIPPPSQNSKSMERMEAAMPLMAAPQPHNVENTETVTSPISMRLQAIPVSAPYVSRIHEATTTEGLYRIYLDLREGYGQSPAFHFDVAQRFYELGDKKLGWRVLSNILEILPRQAASLRIVAYRLQEAGMTELALPLLRQTLVVAPDEPQSYRDLALALSGNCTEALNLLAHVVNNPWERRFAEIGTIALAEYHDIHSRCPDTPIHKWPAPLQDNLPIDLRVVLRWDLSDTDIDLHVTDPNGETANYANRQTYQGGLMSKDFTAGYGPEEFVLRSPKPGTYTVKVNYYGSQLAKLQRGATLNVTLQTGFGTKDMNSKTISLRLLEQSGNVLVGSFEVDRKGLKLSGRQ